MAENPGAAFGYICQNVGVEADTNPGDDHGYVYQNVGVEPDQNPGDAHGYVMQNVATGTGRAVYPYRESRDTPARSRY